jgi:hypothetical protein
MLKREEELHDSQLTRVYRLVKRPKTRMNCQQSRRVPGHCECAPAPRAYVKAYWHLRSFILE